MIISNTVYILMYSECEIVTENYRYLAVDLREKIVLLTKRLKLSKDDNNQRNLIGWDDDEYLDQCGPPSDRSRSPRLGPVEVQYENILNDLFINKRSK